MRMWSYVALIAMAVSGCEVAAPADSQFASEYKDTATIDADAQDAAIDVDADADDVPDTSDAKSDAGMDVADAGDAADDVLDSVADVPGSGDTAAEVVAACAAAGCDDGNACTDDSCDPVKGCQYLANSLACTDDDACTTDDKCSGGGCVPGATTVCDDTNPCTDDSCDKASGCTHAANAIACDDGDACTDKDACAAGVCKPGTNVCCATTADCDDKNGCTIDACLGTELCGHIGKPDGGPCDDGSVCTGNDACKTGKCAGAPALNCNDANACTDDSCDPVAGCKNTANSVACSDGNPCTAPDSCAATVCKGVVVKDGATCSDGNACTAFDGCSAGVCTGVTIDAKVDCDDGNLCTTDTCVAATGCKPVATSCDDQNDCTADSCDKAKGCLHAAAADNVPCNQSYCKAGACACEEQYVAIDVDDGGVKKLVCAPDYPVWGIEADSPVGIYTAKGDGTVADSLTGRTWQQAVPATACGGAATCNWDGAKKYCDQLVLAGKSDWRLPTVTELSSLVDFAKLSPAVNATAFPGVPSEFAWSATAYSGSSTIAWYVVFSYGYSSSNDFAGTYRVRCVR